MSKLFKTGTSAKRVDTGEQVQIIEVIPLNLRVFYRIEYENGERSLVTDVKLREATGG